MTFLTFGVFSIIAAVLTLLLPETLDRNLPDTIQEANQVKSRSNNQELTASVTGDRTRTMSGIEIMEWKGCGGDNEGNTTLIRKLRRNSHLPQF